MSEVIRIIRRTEVQRLTGLCRSAIYQGIANGDFPRAVSLGARSVGWVESEITTWLHSRIAARKEPSQGSYSSPVPQPSRRSAA
jgi:prophage regulatory protein